jgi:hypothetical protein
MSDDTKQIKIMTVDDHPVLRQGMTITPHVIKVATGKQQTVYRTKSERWAKRA